MPALTIAIPTLLSALLALTLHTTPASAQGELSDEQARILAADSDGDGVVTREEFLRHRGEAFGTFDKDNSGDLSRDEFKAALDETPMRSFGAVAFRRTNADGDDGINRAEWDAMPARAFDRLDANGDDKVDSEELVPR